MNILGGLLGYVLIVAIGRLMYHGGLISRRFMTWVVYPIAGITLSFFGIRVLVPSISVGVSMGLALLANVLGCGIFWLLRLELRDNQNAASRATDRPDKDSV